MALKENLRELRESKKLLPREIADKLGISRQSYVNWERGVTVPNSKNLNKLIEIYGVTKEFIMRDSETFEIQHNYLKLSPTRRKNVLNFEGKLH
ncbi:hypothetical protein BG261_07065 [Floricoccus tropicus]|uniref:HTH cro/C1-type domain-containing protein n=1 Tax=Floricoccus tropicus TaxID=1859473 RepID=A0A1E8GK72_9LACT|nr:helix-turn-helix transcriptional regulator [Floricoccus tropicus]OFI48650.1 hypothetical protein BG261_07065 [Floricoccus tropicus]